MKINLAAQAKAAGNRRDRIEARSITPTQAQAKNLARIYMPTVRIWASGARDRILPAYRDALAEQRASDSITMDNARRVDIVVESIDREAVRSVLTFRGLVEEWAEKFELWHLRRLVNAMKYATGVDLSTQMNSGDVAETIDDVVLRNVALIRNVSDQTRGRISDIVFRGLQNRTPAKEVAKEISKSTGMARDRALRIASDQTTKLSTTLDKERQQQLGIKSFIWQHSGKAHPRQEHLERDGKTFHWDSEVGRNDPPGRAINCGCKARAVLELD